MGTQPGCLALWAYLCVWAACEADTLHVNNQWSNNYKIKGLEALNSQSLSPVITASCEAIVLILLEERHPLGTKRGTEEKGREEFFAGLFQMQRKLAKTACSFQGPVLDQTLQNDVGWIPSTERSCSKATDLREQRSHRGHLIVLVVVCVWGGELAVTDSRRPMLGDYMYACPPPRCCLQMHKSTEHATQHTAPFT